MTNPSDILSVIVEHKRGEVSAAKPATSPAELDDRIAACAPSRGFEESLRRRITDGRCAIIAECKKASPSKGIICPDYDIASIASNYEAGGASCLSVLTDTRFFQGSADHLTTARQVTALPVLRKDFIIDPFQIRESCAMGADCILLIAAVLDWVELSEFASEAVELGLDVLIEVHSEAELETALQVRYGMLGINNRNLKTFETTLDTSLHLSRCVPADRLLVSESGIHRASHIQALRAAGIHAFLIGESLMRADHPGTALSAMLAADHSTLQSGASAL